MDTGIISGRYAKAGYEYAVELKEEDKLYEEMKLLAAGFDSFRSLRMIMDNPTITAREKQNLLLSAGGVNVSHSYRSLVELVTKNKREAYMQMIALMYQKYYRNVKNIIPGKLITATSVPEEMTGKFRELVARITGKKADLKMEIDPAIIGGFILEIGSEKLDASIKSQLNKIKLQLTGSVR